MGKRLALIASATLVLAACGAPASLVSSERSDEIRPTALNDDPFEPTTPTEVEVDVTTDPDDPDTAQTDPSTTTVTEPIVVDPDAIDFGADKPERSYDDFLLAAVSDIDAWFTEEFPDAFGIAWEPLEGSVYAGYPERTDALPGCGEAVTRYEDLQQFVAFYCPVGDFIVYDDGDEPIRFADGTTLDPILFSLAAEFGPATIGIVLAHEYGHAVQQRTGALDRNLATVTTEQQADCIAGAWAGRAASGLAPGVPFTDADIRAGLISMITVQDPVGTDPTAPGGHGSGFDRVGAFQVGFRDGLARCAELIDDPLPITPLQFLGEQDFQSGGNATFGFDEANAELFSFLVPDLNLLYDNDLDVAFPNFEQLELVPTQTEAEVVCANPVGVYDDGIVLCLESNTAFLNEPVARQLYDDFGDFGPGYILGIAWAEAAQISANSTATGEERQLRNDCLTGNWVRTVIPELDANGNLVIVTDPTTGENRILLPEPRDPGRTASISPNDLTEAIQTAILIGDLSQDENINGSAFEKIDAFRQGILNGITACT
ncbi:neutral zinc metallopeptidase [Ilumatobacter coccineus]|uniref:Peptidase n=1 Tax=Ilumatobacter coccineus (strain NBRC 103263 / KCTC 29153 / YM16-304) TaxID=1313172 RepID=A0A6C7EBL4_ILUCY|nr:hypothetical protein [Ilumatobacter coccineus]BAN03392.1 hypothetical protein YM304_30780 [Ilumatobacter coccineus YM16-304]